MDLSISSLSVFLKYGRCFSHQGGWHQNRTWPDYTLYWIRSGSLQVELEGQSHTAAPGDAILLNRGGHGAMTAPSDCEFLMICFHMEFGNYRYLFEQLNSAGIYHDSSLLQAGETLQSAFSEESRNPLRFSMAQYGSFLCFLASVLDLTDTHTPFHKPSPRFTDWKLNRLLQRMEKASPEFIPIKDLAAEMDMSEKYFISWFRGQIGFTPGQYMTRERMYLASELLADFTLSLEDVAHRLHYADQYSFSKAFRRFYGEPPGGFRKRMEHTD